MKAVLAALAVLLLALASGCGSDDGNDYTADEIVTKVQEAIFQPGIVFHATGDDGSEVWLDTGNQRFRRQESADRGGLTSIGEGWTRYSYDPFNNVTQEEDLSPGGGEPRINDPAAPWWEPLTSLAYGVELTVIGETTADGATVIAVEARSPVLGSDGTFSGNYLEGRVEINPETFVPTAFEQRELVATGNAESQPTPAQARIRYSYEMAPIENVPEDFFSRSIVDEAVLTLDEHLQTIRDIGLTPYWFGEQYVGELGVLQLPENDNFFSSAESVTAEIHYSFITPVSPTSGEALENSVVIHLARTVDDLFPPNIPEFAGDIPEQRQATTVRGGEAVIASSLLTPSDLPCETGDCPVTRAHLYHRIIFEIGDMAVQIDAMARVDAGGLDRNTFNSAAGLTELAEALTEAIAPSATPTSTP